MRSRRLPGQRQPTDLPPGTRRPPPPQEPAPLPAEVYFDAQSRKREEAFLAAPTDAPEPPAPETQSEQTFQKITRVYGTRTVMAGTLLVQFSIGMLMLPRVVNAAETLLVNPTQLIVLAALGIVELTLAAVALWSRSWTATVASIALGLAWWIYLLIQIA